MLDIAQKGVGSIILTSGTLSPMDSLAQELKLDFPIRLENPHVISSNQLWAGVVSTGPSGYVLNSSYRNRDVPEYKQELGNAIVNFSRVVPEGLLIFFPSYYLMDSCITFWKNGVWPLLIFS
jgi:regulator of telomere elongation helicase 1